MFTKPFLAIVCVIAFASCRKEPSPVKPTVSATIASFKETTFGTLPATIQFVNTSTAADTSSYTWDFGDGKSASTSNAAHTYYSFGQFTAKLTRHYGAGLHETRTKTINIDSFGNVIKDAPVGIAIPTNFTFSPASHPHIVVFTNTSNKSSICYWNFGDGSDAPAVTTASTISHVYATEGLYTIKLVVSGKTGIDSISRTLFLH